MKIAIYGDSFGANYKGWPSFFEKLTNSKVEVLALAGTSVGYSYLKFLETHEQYDRIIFLWTQYNRSWLISTSSDDKTLTHYHSFIQSDSIDNILKSQSYHSREPLTDNVKDWVKSEKHTSTIYESKNLLSVLAMRDSVKLKRPDCLNIEAFDFFEVDKNIITSKKIPGMWRIQLQDMIEFSKKRRLLERENHRPNHLNLIQNVEFSKYLVKAFQDDQFNIHDTFKNPKEYYTMSRTIEESGFIL